ncbi:CGNR zinc finger domain-containing protein [Pyruvatibacter sp. HU-CL02332]|uniref:CGNR zinc finger domain-containing protein n=1 Tax=Pyruvatibacter sp. HU-CL02332 TaxID=3127650 RepID=UPI003108391D
MDNKAAVADLRVGTPPAPGGLILVEGFLNTWSEELNIDDLETAQSAEAWLRNTSLWDGTQKLKQDQHQKLIKFRSDLRSWILDETLFQPLNDLFADIAFHAEFAPSGHIQFVSGRHPFDHALGKLVGAILEGQQDGTWDRLKCCELESCGWAFYDSTRSRTKRWCSMKTCGSRHKAREYYKRKRSVSD